MWTRFMDMRSGGGQKEDFAYLYIEAAYQEAEIIFYNRFGHNPNRVTCTCCGNDYSISEGEDLKELTSFDRNDYESEYKSTQAVVSLETYLSGPEIKVIYANDIKEEERH